MKSLYEDQQATLKDFTERLEKLDIAYMLTGSMAMIAYAMMRMTNDIDIVIDVYPGDAEKIINEFENDFYVPHGRVRDAIARRFMFNLLDQTTLVKIDCVVRKDDEFQRLAFSNRCRINFSGFEVWTISRDDLILSKLKWAQKTRSEMQMRDVAGIIRNGYDVNYVEEWAKKLGVEDLLQECRELLEKNYVDGYDS
ncbi:MAG: nucleotidyltransferase family protein [Acidobacteriota bacterium]|nr:nucleotidyltransferase family protein [Acidobacteriota bacterium]